MAGNLHVKSYNLNMPFEQLSALLISDMRNLQKILLFASLWKQVISCPVGCCICWPLRSNKTETKCSDLTSIPESPTTRYKYVDLSKNFFKRLDKKVFKNKGFTIIENLTLSDCHIQTVDEEAFKGIQNLKTLDLSNNEIVQLSPKTFQGLDQLRNLLLSKNPIKNISDTLFSNLSNLEKLELNHCNINGIRKNTFRDLKKLTALSLIGNDITKVEVESLESLVSLKVLNVNTRSRVCDCRLKPFVSWVLRKENILRNLIPSCTEPDKTIKYLDIHTVSMLVCKPVIVYPLVFDRNGSNVVEFEDRVVLNCSAAGDPFPAFQWFEETSRLNPPSRSSKFSIQLLPTIIIKWCMHATKLHVML